MTFGGDGDATQVTVRNVRKEQTCELKLISLQHYSVLWHFHDDASIETETLLQIRGKNRLIIAST